jgi:hypothetical protein
MKKLFTLILLATLFVSCSSDDDDNGEPKQDYTSFVFVSESISEMKSCVVGYKLSDNTYKKIADLGDFTKGVESKEIKITDNAIKEVYFFTYMGGTYRVRDAFKLEENKKNIFKLTPDLYGVEVSSILDPYQYPQ